MCALYRQPRNIEGSKDIKQTVPILLSFLHVSSTQLIIILYMKQIFMYNKFTLVYYYYF